MFAKRLKVGEKAIVIDAGSGARGCNGMTIERVAKKDFEKDEMNLHGLFQSDPHVTIKTREQEPSYWRISDAAIVERIK